MKQIKHIVKVFFNKERRLKQLEIETSLKELEREELDA